MDKRSTWREKKATHKTTHNRPSDTLSRYKLFFLQTKEEMMILTICFNAFAVLLTCQMLCEVTAENCKHSEYSIFGMMLRGHTFRKLNTSIALECLYACNDDFRCHSFNYVFSQRTCELNKRTKEARPENFVRNSERYYFRRDKKRGKLLYATLIRW